MRFYPGQEWHNSNSSVTVKSPSSQISFNIIKQKHEDTSLEILVVHKDGNCLGCNIPLAGAHSVLLDILNIIEAQLGKEE